MALVASSLGCVGLMAGDYVCAVLMRVGLFANFLK